MRQIRINKTDSCTFNLYDKKEMKEATEFGMMGHCSKVVGNSARKTVEIILKERDK